MTKDKAKQILGGNQLSGISNAANASAILIRRQCQTPTPAQAAVSATNSGCDLQRGSFQSPT
jgi:hypothetical protein